MQYKNHLRPLWLLAAAMPLIAAPAAAVDYYVPSPQYPTIQSALNVCALTGDRVFVSSGTYNEAIDFLGNAVEVIHVQDGLPAVIDGTTVPGQPLVRFTSGEGRGSKLDGFVLRNGTAYSGAGIYIVDAEPTIINCKVESNTAAGFGGGVFILNGVSHTSVLGSYFEDCVFTGNDADLMGGGAYIYYAMATFVDCDFIDNNTSGYYVGGGGLYVDDQSQVLLERCEITYNSTATGDGGGIYCYTESALQIVDTFFCGNEAQTGNGGGIFVGSESNSECINCSFAENTANVGGGLYIHNATQNFYNGILWQNAASTGNGHQIAIRISSSILRVDFCDVQGDQAMVYDPDGANVIWGYTLYPPEDPLFVDQANGNLHLQADSPCIDQGLQNYTTSTLDLDREARVYGNEIEMGADERGPMVCEPHFVDYALGGTVTFTLDAGTGAANRTYVIAGSMTGTSGAGFGSNPLGIPLDWDSYTDYTISGAIPGFVGTLDGNGQATVNMLIPANVSVNTIGKDVHHAFVYLEPGQGPVWASNACTFEIDLY